MLSSETFFKAFTAMSSLPSAAVTSKPRSSLGASGCCAENKIASRIYFSSMSVGRRGRLKRRLGGLLRRGTCNIDLAERLCLKRHDDAQPNQFQQGQECHHDF